MEDKYCRLLCTNLKEPCTNELNKILNSSIISVDTYTLNKNAT